ncbi:MAG: hypothetical protein AVO35_05560 [Candidatus Aegiribacteria sp. MLS_C]|nr:MAG: hypothetical protein AVO35_05560 [Candidatus Aegiribacteria sp. MLS_C]
MKARFLVAVSLLSWTGLCISESAFQTEWSEPDIWGPVTTWQDRYLNAVKLQTGETLQLVLQPVCQTVQQGLEPRAVACGDISGDGYADIVATVYLAGIINWWENDGTGTGWSLNTIATDFEGARRVQVADMDGDGDQDVIACAFDEDEVSWWENTEGTGQSWEKHVILSGFNGPFAIHALDIDGDQDTDLLATSFFGSTEQLWWENTDGSGTAWESHVICDDVGTAFDCYGADIDADGDIDACFNDITYDRLYWCENLDGAGNSWMEHTIALSYIEGSRVCAGDIDGDGDLDLVSASDGAYVWAVEWWENADGQGNIWNGPNTVIDVEQYPSSVCIEDIDLDGDNDLIVSFRGPSGIWQLTVFENTDGHGDFWGTDISQGYNHFWDLCAADLNGDDYAEIVSACAGAGRVLSYDAGLAGRLESSVLDTQGDSYWGYLSWECEGNGTVCFQVRSSDTPDSGQMDPWSERIYEPGGIEEYISGNDRYFQYRAILETTNMDSTPYLNSVYVEYEPTGLESGQPAGEARLGVYPNPARSAAEAMYCVPMECDLELYVYDLSGRLVISRHLSDVARGEHMETLDELQQGIYLMRMRWPGGVLDTRFLLLD